MKLKASLDLPAKLITLVYAVFCMVFSIYAINICFDQSTEIHDKIVIGSIAIMLFSILIITCLFAPKSYTVTDSAIIVNRVIGNKVFLKSEIDSLTPISDKEIKTVSRVAGVGGMFGYFGRFQSHSIGQSTFYTTQRKNLTLLSLKNGKKIVISPDQNEVLLNGLNQS